MLLYETCISQIEKLKDLLVFQERRNFFNKIQDIHLNSSIKIVETILNKSYEFEFSHEDLAEVINITLSMIGLLDVSKDVHDHLYLMKQSSIELKKQSLNLINI